MGKGLFSLPLHNPGRIISILTHINTFISELVFSLGERREEFRMLYQLHHTSLRVERRLQVSTYVWYFDIYLKILHFDQVYHNEL